MSITIGYSPFYLQWTGSHASPQRAHLAVEHIKAAAGEEDIEVRMLDIPSSLTYRESLLEELELIHDPKYLTELHEGTHPMHSGEQGFVAEMMFAGTERLVRQI